MNNSSAPCDVSARPVASRACVAACMVDCRLSEWSQWSECGGGCGEQARRSRYRTVQTLAQHGGVPCPAQALEHGTVHDTHILHLFEHSCFHFYQELIAIMYVGNLGRERESVSITLCRRYTVQLVTSYSVKLICLITLICI